MSEEYHCAFVNVRKLSNSEFAFLIISKHALLGVFDFKNSEMWSSSDSNNAAPCRTCYQSVASHGVIRPRFAEKVYFILLFAHFMLVHVIKRISNEFSFHTMYYTTRFIIHRMEWKFIWDPIYAIYSLTQSPYHSTPGSYHYNYFCVVCHQFLN